eukprot:TRINITY_DN1860_c0_g1_i1.p1 TRINITY_DN1860_c0_g1~~TRINITY_DN1860_c0_g1_i1.p1  ORF type:complete len:357 (-),score=72.03 TRINITY_DN1860_c0_g1_i1:52-1122(-)
MANAGLLWVDKYRPENFDEIDLHPKISVMLKKMCDSPNFPHLLVYGPSGSGKKTRVMAMLQELFGPGVRKIRVDHKSIKVNTKTVELTTLSSNYHIELNPSDVGFQDRHVVQEIIKEIAQGKTLESESKRDFKVVVLTEVDKLSKEAQHALRRTMEKYMSTCRLILLCNSISKVTEPVRSRCLGIRIPAPQEDEIINVLIGVAKHEKINLPKELAVRIAEQSDRDLRKALLVFEATKSQHYPFKATTPIQRSDWEEFIIQIAKEIAEDQSQKTLAVVRSKFYELLTHCIPPEIVLKNLAVELMKKVDSELKYEVIKWAAFFEHRMQIGSKPIFHLEAFVAKFMSIYKRFLNQLQDF